MNLGIEYDFDKVTAFNRLHQACPECGKASIEMVVTLAKPWKYSMICYSCGKAWMPGDSAEEAQDLFKKGVTVYDDLTTTDSNG